MAPQTRSPVFYATLAVALVALAGVAKALAMSMVMSVATGG
jgi:hypothetical protein